MVQNSKTYGGKTIYGAAVGILMLDTQFPRAGIYNPAEVQVHGDRLAQMRGNFLGLWFIPERDDTEMSVVCQQSSLLAQPSV